MQQHLRRIKCHRISTTHKTACQFKSYEYSFLDLPDLNCSCENNIEMENYTCLHCTKFSELTFLQKIQVIEPNILMKSCGNITRLLSVGLNSLCNWNTTLTSASINSETSWPRRSFMYPWADYIVLQYLSVNIY